MALFEFGIDYERLGASYLRSRSTARWRTLRKIQNSLKSGRNSYAQRSYGRIHKLFVINEVQ